MVFTVYSRIAIDDDHTFKFHTYTSFLDCFLLIPGLRNAVRIRAIINRTNNLVHPNGLAVNLLTWYFKVLASVKAFLTFDIQRTVHRGILL